MNSPKEMIFWKKLIFPVFRSKSNGPPSSTSANLIDAPRPSSSASSAVLKFECRKRIGKIFPVLKNSVWGILGSFRIFAKPMAPTPV